METLDPTDIRLLDALQQNAILTTQELGDALALSPSQAGRRKQRLEAAGYIRAYAARLEPSKLGLDVQSFVQVLLASHDPEGSRDFRALMKSRREVISMWALTGEADYLLRIYTADLARLNMLIQDVILPHRAVGRVQSQIVMDQPKADAGLPL
ncbi:MAG: Lrp/AsnC family transcriptional regulator [Rhodobacteraceae bacterium]|nr:Lrp/AsnC family transcriptional regulator [Paracoccaceae bacterium]